MEQDTVGRIAVRQSTIDRLYNLKRDRRETHEDVVLRALELLEAQERAVAEARS